MPYNSKHIEGFIKRVNQEAEEAAQKVFDKYQQQLDEMIVNQMVKGDELEIVMGSAIIHNREFGFAYNFLEVVSNTQYSEQRAGFNCNIYTK